MTSDKLHFVEKPVIQSIIDSLSCLNNGVIEGDNFWVLKDFTDGRTLRKKTHASSFPNHLEQIEAIKNALQILVQSCERKLATIQSTQGAVGDHRGVDSLSDDVLALIFKSASGNHDDDGPPYRLPPAIKISHVCRRFRAVALDIPSLWSLVSTEQPLGYVKECLKRTRESGLSIWIYIDYGAVPRPEGFTLQEQLELTILKSFGRTPEDVRGFLDLVCGHSRRWTSLHFIPVKWADRASILSCLERLSALDFPNLKIFEFSASLKLIEELPTKDFSRSWKMPKLRTLRLDDVFIAKVSQFHSSKNITTVDLAWNRFDEHQLLRPNLPALVDFLSSLPNLANVRLDLNLDDEEQETAPTDSFVLPKLERLDVDLASSAFRNLVHGMQTPALKTLGIETRSIHEAVDAVTPDMAGSVQELTIKTWANTKAGPDLRSVLKKFPQLERLELVAGQAPFPKFSGLGDPPMPMPPLRSLAIKTNGTVNKAFVSAFFRALKESGQWETFQTFKVKWKKKKRTPDYLHTLIEQGKQIINLSDDDGI